MNNEKMLFYGVLGVGTLWFFTQKEVPENMFSVNGVDVPESELPNLGYAKFNGQWFLKSDIIQAAKTNGVTGAGNIDIGTQLGFDIFMTLLSAGAGIAASVIANKAQRKADLIEQIETMYTSVVSLSFDPDFPFTNAELNALTIPKLEQILDGNFTINGVRSRPDINHNVQCIDGKYTSSNGRGSCSHHRGVQRTGGRAPWIDNL